MSNKDATDIVDATINLHVYFDIAGAVTRAKKYFKPPSDPAIYQKQFGKYDGKSGKITSGEPEFGTANFDGEWLLNVKLDTESIDVPLAVIYVLSEELSSDDIDVQNQFIEFTGVDDFDTINQLDGTNGASSSDDSVSNFSNQSLINLSNNYVASPARRSGAANEFSRLILSAAASSSSSNSSDDDNNNNNDNDEVVEDFYNQYGLNNNVC